jgi:hypothetical protein
VQVTSDSPSLVAAVQRLATVLTDAGATFHPGLRIVHRGRELSVWADGEDPWLMRIPEATLVPVGGITWSDEPPLRVIEAHGLTPLQRQVLEACVDVMREAGSWEHYRSTHPRGTITDPQAVEIIRSLHPAFSPDRTAAGMIKTRTIRMSLHDHEPASYLMPLLDLVNHHPAAPIYLPEDGFLGIATTQDTPGGECFVSYGSTRDVLGIALAYGYVEESITRANALPGHYPLPGGGTLHLVRASRPDFTSEPGVLTIVGAGFDTTDSTITRRTLIEPIERFLIERGDAPMQARHTARVMARRIAVSDRDRLARARSSLTDVPGTELVQAAVRRQEAVLAAIG